MLDGYEIEIVVEYRRNGGNSMFNIREMKPEDKAVIMPMVITFYHSPAVEHDVDTAVLERTFDAATDPTMPYISGLVMLEDEKVVGYGYVTGYYASEVGGMCTAQKPITGLWTIIRNTSASESKSQKVMSTPNAFMSAGDLDSWNITRWCWIDKWASCNLCLRK